MLYRTDDFTRWGAGKGTNLEPLEIDLNFWELAERLVAVEASAGEAANGIANIGVVGSQMTVYLQDGTSLGPYTLPTAMIHYRGDWAAATAYNEMDLVTVPDAGVYLVLVDHTSDATFDALAQDGEGDPLYRWLFPIGTGGGGASSIDDLTDVVISPTPPEDGDTLIYSGGTFYAGRPQLVLDELTNVVIINPPFAGGLADGDVLTWVAADSVWRNRPASGGGATALDGLTDVTITGPATGQFLRYDGTVFVNAVVGWADIDGKPSTFAPEAHSHPWSDITGRPTVVDALPATIGANGTVLKVSAGAIVWGTDDTGGGSGSGASVSDEGSQILAAPTDLNFAGAGVTVTDDGDGTITITIPGGASFGGALDDLSDVTIASPSTGHVLRFDGSGFVNAPVDWSDLANVPATFDPAAHTHAYGDLTGIPATFAPSAHTHAWGDLTGVPATFAPEAHTHPAAEIDGAVVETIAGTTYTQVAADRAKWKRTTNAAAVTVTIDASVNAAGDEITFQQGAAGAITFVAGAGMTLTSSGSLVSGGEGAVVGIKFLSATEATLFGHTTAEEGGASGDMTAAVYDPTSVAADAFARANHHGEQAISTVTGLATALSGRNRLINGSFDIWQRGTSLAAATGQRYLSDRWATHGAGSTVAPSRQSFTVGQTDVPSEPTFFHRAVVASVAGAANLAYMWQRLEGVRSLAGQTVTLTFYAKADAAKNVALEFVQNFGTGGTPSAAVTGIGTQLIALTTAWQRFVVSVAIPSIAGKTVGSDGNDHLQVSVWFDAGSDFNTRTATLGQRSGTFDIAQLQLEPGSIATTFEKRPAAAEIHACARYCQRSMLVGRFWATATDQFYEAPVNFYSPMRATPTATIEAGATNNNMGGDYPKVVGLSATGARFSLKSVAAGDTYSIGGNVLLDAEL